ncbi:MAG: hypothetical protein V1808_00180 [Candidatus Daviesbacteria bacterium]
MVEQQEKGINKLPEAVEITERNNSSLIAYELQVSSDEKDQEMNLATEIKAVLCLLGCPENKEKIDRLFNAQYTALKGKDTKTPLEVLSSMKEFLLLKVELAREEKSKGLTTPVQSS